MYVYIYMRDIYIYPCIYIYTHICIFRFHVNSCLAAVFAISGLELESPMGVCVCVLKDFFRELGCVQAHMWGSAPLFFVRLFPVLAPLLGCLLSLEI